MSVSIIIQLIMFFQAFLFPLEIFTKTYLYITFVKILTTNNQWRLSVQKNYEIEYKIFCLCICEKLASDKRSTFRVYKELRKLNSEEMSIGSQQTFLNRRNLTVQEVKLE